MRTAQSWLAWGRIGLCFLGERQGGKWAVLFFPQAWRLAQALLAHRWLMRFRSQWSYAGCPWQPSAWCEQRSWLSQVFFPPHLNLIRTLFSPPETSVSVCGLWKLPPILWRSASCHDFVSGTLQKPSSLPGTHAHLPARTPLLPLSWLTLKQLSLLSFKVRSSLPGQGPSLYFQRTMRDYCLCAYHFSHLK